MQLPESVFISNKDLPGGELLLNTKTPFNIARVYKFEDGTSMENFIKKNNLLNSCGICHGYRILVCYIGTISGISEGVTLGHLVNAEDLETIKKLTEFYEENRIKGNESRFKKFART
jgi:hypothetical protein